MRLGSVAARFERFVAVGNEAARRKSLSFRTTGKQAQYLTVIEPFEDQSKVTSVTAASANEATVELNDGRTHILKIQGLEEGKDLTVTIQEYKAGKLIREETHNESN